MSEVTLAALEAGIEPYRLPLNGLLQRELGHYATGQVELPEGFRPRTFVPDGTFIPQEISPDTAPDTARVKLLQNFGEGIRHATGLNFTGLSTYDPRVWNDVRRNIVYATPPKQSSLGRAQVLDPRYPSYDEDGWWIRDQRAIPMFVVGEKKLEKGNGYIALASMAVEQTVYAEDAGDECIVNPGPSDSIGVYYVQTSKKQRIPVANEIVPTPEEVAAAYQKETGRLNLSIVRWTPDRSIPRATAARRVTALSEDEMLGYAVPAGMARLASGMHAWEALDTAIASYREYVYPTSREPRPRANLTGERRGDRLRAAVHGLVEGVQWRLRRPRSW